MMTDTLAMEPKAAYQRGLPAVGMEAPPADAAIHRDLELTAGRARALLEEALIRVARAEGMPLPASANTQP